MIQGSDGAGLALEAGQAVGVASHVGRQDFEGDVAPELGIGRAIHFSHAAGANRGVNLVVGQCVTEQTGLSQGIHLSVSAPELRQPRFYTTRSLTALMAAD